MKLIGASIGGMPIDITRVRIHTETLTDVVRELEQSEVRITPDGLLDDADRNRIDASLAPFGWRCDPTCNLFESRDIRMLETECHHAKVYSGEMQPTLSPLWFWVCSRCGKDGTEHLAEPPACDVAAFWNTFVVFGRMTREEADHMLAMQTRKVK